MEPFDFDTFSWDREFRPRGGPGHSVKTNKQHSFRRYFPEIAHGLLAVARDNIGICWADSAPRTRSCVMRITFDLMYTDCHLIIIITIEMGTI